METGLYFENSDIKRLKTSSEVELMETSGLGAAELGRVAQNFLGS